MECIGSKNYLGTKYLKHTDVPEKRINVQLKNTLDQSLKLRQVFEYFPYSNAEIDSPRYNKFHISDSPPK